MLMEAMRLSLLDQQQQQQQQQRNGNGASASNSTPMPQFAALTQRPPTPQLVNGVSTSSAPHHSGTAFGATAGPLANPGNTRTVGVSLPNPSLTAPPQSNLPIAPTDVS